MIRLDRSALAVLFPLLLLFNGFKKTTSFKPLVSETIYMWSGALTPNTVRVTAKLSEASTQARLAVSTTPDFANPSFGQYVTANSTNNFMASMNITGLTPNTKYYYAVEVDGNLDNSLDDIGSFTTPRIGAQSFKFTVGSCNNSSAHVVFTKMAEKNPLLEVISGDFHYANPNSGTNINVHRLPYENNMLSQTASRNFHLQYPLAYVWDDHDYCGDNSGSSAAGRTNARLVYQEYVPHYPLAAGSGNVPIYQSFTIGRIHFIMSDLRSMRGVGNTASSDPNLSMMGTVQKQWFKDQCLYAKNNNLIIAWVTGVSFGGNQSDNWGGFREERKELSDFFQTNNILNMFLLSGDAHMVAIDNGSNHDFSTAGNSNDYPVFQAAALNQSGGYKGGTYSEIGPVIPNGANNSYINPNSSFGQYGVVDITDAGGSQVSINFTAYRVTSAGAEQLLVSYNFTRNLLAAVPVQFSSFTLKNNSNSNISILNWSASSDDCSEFTVERSGNEIDFTSIETLKCSANSNYQFTDNSPLSGWNYYRIKAIDRNGLINYSPIKKAFFGGPVKISIAPNPVRGSMKIIIDNLKSDVDGNYSIHDIKMRLLQQGTIRLQAGRNQNEIRIHDLTPGVYFIRLNFNNSTVHKKFMVE
jgi:alkaline phosphatase D